MVAIVLEAFPESENRHKKTWNNLSCLTYTTPLLCQLAGSNVLKMTRSRTIADDGLRRFNAKENSMFDQIVHLESV